MTKLACYIYQWYVVVLLVLGYAILSNGAEFQGIKVIINGGTLNPYLASLQRKELEKMKLEMVKEKRHQGQHNPSGRKDKTLRSGTSRTRY